MEKMAEARVGLMRCVKDDGGGGRGRDGKGKGKEN